MILIKEYVSLATAAMKMGKNIFTVIIVMVAKTERCFTGQFQAKLSRAYHPYLMDF